MNIKNVLLNINNTLFNFFCDNMKNYNYLKLIII
jgi:hypothetical protein